MLLNLNKYYSIKIVHVNICIYFFNINSGQSPAEADLNLLETARRCELYGMKMHPAKVNNIQTLVFLYYTCYIQMYIFCIRIMKVFH